MLYSKLPLISSMLSIWFKWFIFIKLFIYNFQALYVIRYHSFFPWHCSGDYNYLCDDKDMKMLEWVKEFKWVIFAA